MFLMNYCRKRILIAYLGLLAVNLHSSESLWRWQVEDGVAVSLLGSRGELWRFNYGPEAIDLYFDPLRTIMGDPLSWMAPSDHVWHLGLWFSWKYINGVNFWEFDKRTGKPVGITKMVGSNVTWEDSETPRIEVDLQYFLESSMVPLLTEHVVIQPGLPDADGTYVIDWNQTTTAVSPCTLDSTPSPDRENGRPNGGYGGLSFRGSPYFREVVIRASNGLENRAIHGKGISWIDAAGKVNDRDAGISILVHPENFGYPVPGYVINNEHFKYINPALLFNGPIQLSQSQSIHQRYRIIVRSKPFKRELLEVEYFRFCANP